MQKSKSSYISLENEFYGESSVVYESGSARDSYGAFTDDDPTAGVAEALAKKKAELDKKNIDNILFNHGNLLLDMSGAKATSVIVPTDKSSIPLSGDALRDRADVEVFDSKKVYKGEYVKAQAGDDEFILGKAYPQGSGSVFVPSDPSAAIEHAGTFKNHLQTAGNAAMNVVNQIYYDMEKVEDYVSYAKATLTFDQDGKLNARSHIESINEEKEKTNKYYRDRATYKAAYDADNSIMNLAMAVDGIGGIASIPEKISSIGTGLNNGIKIMNGTKLALEGTKGLEISVAGIGAVTTSGARALEAGLGINNMSENDSSNGSGNNSGAENNESEEVIKDASQLENGKLKPNVNYKTGEHDYIYKTNEDGLITNARTDSLQFKTHEGRLDHNPDTYGKEVGDHAGHLFGDRFGGSPELDNLVSQAQKVNQSEFKIIENQWARALKNGQKVTVDITINYANGSTRPISFDVSYTIDNVPFFTTIGN